MKSKFYKILQKHLHKFGIYIQYYPSDKAIHYHLKSKPVNIQNYELNKLSKTIRSAGNHSFYNSLLKRFVPSWDVALENASFVVGGGGGESSLNAFRKVKIGGTFFFEKIYFSEHEDLKRIRWFYQHASALLTESGLVVPKVRAMYEGDAFVIVYFNFLDLKSLEDFEMQSAFFKVSELMYRASMDTVFTAKGNELPEYLTNFKNHFEYKNKISRGKLRLGDIRISQVQIEKNVSSSKLIFTHGDIQEKNVFKNQINIDWDTFGLYPIGFDFAFSCYQLLKDEKISPKSVDGIIEDCKMGIDKNYWIEFERNFVYFLFIFLGNYFKKEDYKELELGLIQKMRDLFSSDIFE
ncbi:hypothetical protein EI546_06290 [Aequorivita sp. H23M31]|uniref:Aminoglycoside phosphotransferase domain-containing protein n=1 Tax=Aequorivita ciconiae TaxID=2494375 RepID=A0A410G285_9FLAO|nr:hypothetical protein [Aequorivita sp. H23M31]QAA81359.1 hypothetical protein EI546_06290 [Aequorivita sp. H23M31]